MHLDWAGREQALGPDRQGAQRDRRSLFPFFCGSRKGGAAEGCEGTTGGMWPRANLTAVETPAVWEIRYGRTVGQNPTLCSGSGKRALALCDKMGTEREGTKMGRHGFASEIGTFISILR